MLEAREEVEHEILWELNSGNTSVWHENWTGIGPLYHVLPQEFNINEKLQEVEELRNGDTWDELTLDQNFPADISDHIRHNVSFHHTTEELDTPQWMPTTTGKFYVNSAWRIMRQRATHNPELCNLWTKVLPFKIFFFLWRLWKMKIPTDDLWRRNGYIIVSKCWCCSPPKEDSYQYLFLKSETVNRVWKSFLQLAGIIINMVQVHQVVRAWWSEPCCPKLKPLFQATPAIITWELWKRRNKMKHGGAVSEKRSAEELSGNCPMQAGSNATLMEHLKGTQVLVLMVTT
ncbi:uncharacterized protein [Nicotiana tomentosiformis]|uniref:uncharacterized protein n=1 Tax=Nicotiana tomentosiformis TaxID=4098 RepID=UPI00388C5A14